MTAVDDPVMSPKGEAIYRRRPFCFVLETITLQRMRVGAIADRIVERVRSSNTHVLDPERLPAADPRALQQDFVRLGPRLLVAGHAFGVLRRGQVATFQVHLAGCYVLLRNGQRMPLRSVGDDRAWLADGDYSLHAPMEGAYRLQWCNAVAGTGGGRQ